MNHKTRELTLIKIFTFLIGAMLLVLTLISCIKKEKFESEAWKANPKLRYYMLGDLIENKYVIGMTKDEVIRSLDTTDIKQYNYQDNNWMYIIDKSIWVPATDLPVEVVDITFKDNKVETIIKRE